MRTFNSIEELKPYYNKNTNTYEFVENGVTMDVEFKFNLDVNSHILAGNIKSGDINAWNINAWNINSRNIIAWNINAGDINAGNIKAGNIKAGDINTGDINAGNINAGDINSRNIIARNIEAWNIKAGDINAGNINAWNINSRNISAGNIKAGEIKAGDIKAWNINAGVINACDISYYALCFAYQNISCTSIKGRRENAKHFVLDGEITIKTNINVTKKIQVNFFKDSVEMSKERRLKELQEFRECFYDERKANTAELKRKRIEEYIEKSHKALYEMHEEKLALLDELEELKRDVKRFMELINHIGNESIIEHITEYGKLHDKLSKVGVKDV